MVYCVPDHDLLSITSGAYHKANNNWYKLNPNQSTAMTFSKYKLLRHPKTNECSKLKICLLFSVQNGRMIVMKILPYLTYEIFLYTRKDMTSSSSMARPHCGNSHHDSNDGSKQHDYLPQPKRYGV